MATYTWRTTNGAFDNANNWNPAVVPGTGDTALFNASGGTISDNGSVDTIGFSNAAWTISGQLSSNTVSLTSGSVAISGSSAQLLVATAYSVIGGAAFSVQSSGLLSVSQSATASLGPATLNVNSRGIANFNGTLRLGAGVGATTATVDAGVLTAAGVLALGTVAGGNATLLVQDGGEAVINAAADATKTYLQLGVVAGSLGTVRVDGANTLLLSSQDSAGVGIAGYGELDVTNGASARFNTTNNGLDPALIIGVLQASSGLVAISGAGSSITTGGSVIVGEVGSGTLHITGGATVTSSSTLSVQAALAVGAAASGAGTLTIDGSGSQFVASGAAFVGGDNRGSGTTTGGVGSIAITNGASLQTNSLTVEPGSSVVIDGTSKETVSGDLSLSGTLTSYGTLSVSGTLSGAGTLALGGGFARVGGLSQSNIEFLGSDATVLLSGVYGISQVTGMQSQDVIDLVGDSTATISGNTVATSSGSLSLGGSGPFELSPDGNGGTFVSIGVGTVGVFRFFDTDYGTHFFTSSTSEEATIIQTRPDLVYEGIGLEAIDPADNDPNAAPVYRFFDSTYGTHFFTASTSERDTVIATRSDLVYEGVGFLEHTVEQPGDVPVYRFFDTRYGTHFYTDDASERATIVATRPDLVDEGIGFYAPS